MALANISSVAITLDTTGVSRAGFGTPLFLAAGNFFLGRTAEYASVAEAAAVFPLDTNQYLAIAAFFRNTPDVPVVKIGQATCVSKFVPDIYAADGTTLIEGIIVAITVTDDTGDTVTYSRVTQTGDTATSISGLAVTAINADSVKVVAASDGVGFKITKDVGYEFVTSAHSNVTFSALSKEAYNTALAAIIQEDNDFYAITLESRVDADIELIAVATESLDKIFVFGSSDTDAIDYDVDSGSAGDVIAALAADNLFRTVAYWHHDCDGGYPECTFLGYNLPFDAGVESWGNIKVPIGYAQDPRTGKKLSSTQLNNLQSRNCNFQVTLGGVDFNREGKVLAGEWIDIIRGRDALTSDLNADLVDLLISKQGTTLPYTDEGINEVLAVVQNRVYFYRDQRGFLTDPISFIVPKSAGILRADKVSRTLNGLSFTATLSGAIHIVNITGVLSV